MIVLGDVWNTSPFVHYIPPHRKYSHDYLVICGIGVANLHVYGSFLSKCIKWQVLKSYIYYGKIFLVIQTGGHDISLAIVHNPKQYIPLESL